MTEERKHAKYSASGSEKWINCPGAAEMEDCLPNPENDAAKEGTLAHKVVECMFNGSPLPDDIPDEMIKYCEGYVKYVKSYEGDLYTELRVDYSRWVEDGFGTSDNVIMDDKHANVIDFKYGFVPVYPENNSQLMLYALGVMDTYEWVYDFQYFTLHIYQPRKEIFESWTVSRDDLLEFGGKVRAMSGLYGSPLFPGKHCKYCRAKTSCPALSKKMTEYFKRPKKMTAQKMKEVLDGADVATQWIKTVKQEALDEVSAGGKIEGFKLVRGKSNRKWKDEEKAIETLGEHFTETKIMSPAAVERSDKSVDISELIFKPKGAVKLVPESDRGKEIKICDFEKLT